jgi:hypothetical protein
MFAWSEHACDQWHSSRKFTPLTGLHCKLRPNTEGTRTLVSIHHLVMMVNRGAPGLLARAKLFKLFRPELQVVDRIDVDRLALDGVRFSILNRNPFAIECY